MAPKTIAKKDARTRLLETADRLFYAEGINSVGIDRIIAEAEVAKMTLYNHFPSKDDLVLAVLQFREEKIFNLFQTNIEKYAKKGRGQLEAFFAALKEWFKSPDFRGCVFMNTAAEFPDPKHPAAKFSAAHKQRFSRMIAGLIKEDFGEKATSAASAIALIVEGAIVSAVMHQKPNSADLAKRASLALVSSTKK